MSHTRWQRGKFSSELSSVADITCAIAVDDAVVNKTYAVADKEWMKILWVKSVGSNTEVNQYWITELARLKVNLFVVLVELVKRGTSSAVTVSVGLLDNL